MLAYTPNTHHTHDTTTNLCVVHTEWSDQAYSWWYDEHNEIMCQSQNCQEIDIHKLSWDFECWRTPETSLRRNKLEWSGLHILQENDWMGCLFYLSSALGCVCVCVFYCLTAIIFWDFSSFLQMYFVSKILAEKAAMEAAKEDNINFISIIPPVVVGPFFMPTFPPSLITALSPITGDFHGSSVQLCRVKFRTSRFLTNVFPSILTREWRSLLYHKARAVCPCRWSMWGSYIPVWESYSRREIHMLLTWCDHLQYRRYDQRKMAGISYPNRVSLSHNRLNPEP